MGSRDFPLKGAPLHAIGLDYRKRLGDELLAEMTVSTSFRQRSLTPAAVTSDSRRAAPVVVD